MLEFSSVVLPAASLYHPTWENLYVGKILTNSISARQSFTCNKLAGSVLTWRRRCGLLMPSSQWRGRYTDCAGPRTAACSQLNRWRCASRQTAGTWRRLDDHAASSHSLHWTSTPDNSTPPLMLLTLTQSISQTCHQYTAVHLRCLAYNVPPASAHKHEVRLSQRDHATLDVSWNLVIKQLFQHRRTVHKMTQCY